MTLSAFVIHLVLAAVYFGGGWLAKHVATPAATPATAAVGDHLWQEFEQQAIAMIRTQAAQIFNGSPPATAPVVAAAAVTAK